MALTSAMAMARTSGSMSPNVDDAKESARALLDHKPAACGFC
jgi:hypothetical protein